MGIFENRSIVLDENIVNGMSVRSRELTSVNSKCSCGVTNVYKTDGF